ncbi:origin recognition complex subunit 5 C-terminus-domain-containing protein [Xylariomycetidae sp. FL0641]|nr:origin recognition complex subunit 5 C-terminus-domain-containing protein [Xylariomycetidae sp. FL0641]
MGSLFELPDDLIAHLVDGFPCRDAQIRALATLLSPRAAPVRNLVIHGTEATGKTAITQRLLEGLRDAHASAEQDLELFNYAIVKSAECVTTRHLFERTVGLVAEALDWKGVPPSRCETLAALTVELSKMLKYVERDAGWRFVLVFDGIDRQREAPPTLIPGLARLSEIIPNLTTVSIVTTPAPATQRLAGVPHLHFPAYTKAECLSILAAGSPPPALPNTSAAETAELHARFAAAVHDALARPAARSLPALRRACAALWPRFTAPVAAGTHRAREFSRLLVASRAYFGDEGVLAPGVLLSSSSSRAVASSASTPTPSSSMTTAAAAKKTTTDLATLLPPTARLLLIAAYLASHNAPRFDATLFSTWHARAGARKGRRRNPVPHHHHRRNPAGSQHRKIARKLLGPGIFGLERMVAIYVATRREWVADGGGGGGGGGGEAAHHHHHHQYTGVDADVGMAIATLASLRLLVKVGGGAGIAAQGAGMGGADLDRGGRWRVNVGWEVVRGVGRSMGVEVEEWLIE